MIRNTLCILFVFASLVTCAQPKLARISGDQKLVDVYSDLGETFVVDERLDSNDLFYCEWTDADWLKVSGVKGWTIEGYVHKEEMDLIENLPLTIRRDMVESAFLYQLVLAQNFTDLCKTGEHSVIQTAALALNDHNDTRYSPLLDVFQDLFCETKDTALFQLFLDVLKADRGSANELPGIAAGKCYVCEPDLVLKIVEQNPVPKECSLYYNYIDFGLLNIYNKTDGIYLELMIKLEKTRKRACPY